MKRFALFALLALVAAVTADEKVTLLAQKFETDEPTIENCLNEAQVTVVEIFETEKKWKHLEDDGDAVNEEAKQLFKKHNSFIACLLEKKDLMQDEKLIVDKVVEMIQNDKDIKNPPSTDELTQCIKALNDNTELTREDRSFGLVLCILTNDSDES